MLSCRCRFFSLSLLCSSVHQREKGGGFLRGPLSSGTKAAAHSHLLLQLLGADVWCPHSTLCLALSSHKQYTNTHSHTHQHTTHHTSHTHTPHTHVHADTSTHAWPPARHTHTVMHTHMHIHTDTQTCTHTHTHTCM